MPNSQLTQKKMEHYKKLIVKRLAFEEGYAIMKDKLSTEEKEIMEKMHNEFSDEIKTERGKEQFRQVPIKEADLHKLGIKLEALYCSTGAFIRFSNVWHICLDLGFLLKEDNILKYSENAIRITLYKNDEPWQPDSKPGSCMANKELDEHFAKYTNGRLICEDREELAQEISYLYDLLGEKQCDFEEPN